MAAPRTPSAALVGPYDYTTRAHIALYDKNTESLYGDRTGRYGLEPEGLQAFMLLVDARVQSANWKEMLTYQVINNAGNLQATYLVEHYGEIPGLVIRNNAIAYLTQGGRRSQDSEQLYQCIKNSLNEAAFSRVMTDKAKFQIDIAGTTLTDGPLFLMTAVSLAYTNTRAMSSVHRNKLSQLTQKMQSIPNNDITVFNTYVTSLVVLLAAGGEKCEDLAWNLIRAYKSTADEKFNNYIATKEEQWKDGSINWGANGNEIMALAENYYKDAVQNETWMQVTKEQERIIALEAQIRAFKPHHNRTKSEKSPKKDAKKGDADVGRKWPKWKDEAPTGSQPHTKKRDNKTFHWCPNHSRWTIHTAAECNLAPSTSTEIAAEATVTNPSHHAMTTVTADSDSDSDDSNDTADSNN